MSLRCGKKRKLIVDHEAEKSIYGSFVAAANAVSTLYSQAVQQQRRASAQASRQALERVVAFLLAQNPGSEVVSKATLLQFLQQEYESIEGGEHVPHAFPAPQYPVVGPGQPTGAEPQPEPPSYGAKAPRTGSASYYCSAAGVASGVPGVSPSRRAASGGCDGMDSSDGPGSQPHQHQHQQHPQEQPQPVAPLDLGGFAVFTSGPAGFGAPHMGGHHPL